MDRLGRFLARPGRQDDRRAARDNVAAGIDARPRGFHRIRIHRDISPAIGLQSRRGRLHQRIGAVANRDHHEVDIHDEV